MRNKAKKCGMVLLAGILCITLFSACSGAGSFTSTKQNAELSESVESSVYSEDSDIDQNVQEDVPDVLKSEFVGASVGEFETQDIYGQPCTKEIFQDYELTMVNVFATWCSPCVAEIPDLEELHNKMADKSVNIVGVILDVLDEKGEPEQDGLKRAQLLAEQTGATYPFLLPDETYMNGRLIGIEAVPETFFVDKDGNIVGDTYSGSRSLEDWTDIVEQELARLGTE